MGSVFKKTVTKAVPPGAEIVERKGQRLARWKDRRGKTRTALLTIGEGGSDRIVIEAGKWYAKYRDGGGAVRVVPTGCRTPFSFLLALGAPNRPGPRHRFPPVAPAG